MKNRIIAFMGMIFPALVAGYLFTSCSKDSPAIEIADVHLHFAFAEIGGTQFATVKCPQDFTAESDALWCETEIYPGGRNNNLRITVSTNTLSETRTATITVAAPEQEPVLITVEQEAAAPVISVGEDNVTISAQKQEFGLGITSNVDFTYDLPSWISLRQDNVPATGTARYWFVAEELTGLTERTGNIVVRAVDESLDLDVTVPVTQTNEEVPVFEDNFDWAVSDSYDIFTSSGEIRMDNWPEEGRHWTTQADGNPGAWTRLGYLKLCYGKKGMDIVTPKLSSIVGTRDIEVSFKACRYISPTGIEDQYHEINVSVLGPGTPDVTHFEVNNRPDTQEHEHGEGWLWTDDPESEYTFTVTGATAETRIVFLAGPKLGTLDANSRMGFDEVKIVLK